MTHPIEHATSSERTEEEYLSDYVGNEFGPLFTYIELLLTKDKRVEPRRTGESFVAFFDRIENKVFEEIVFGARQKKHIRTFEERLRDVKSLPPPPRFSGASKEKIMRLNELAVVLNTTKDRSTLKNAFNEGCFIIKKEPLFPQKAA